jgi:hypothetical protein
MEEVEEQQALLEKQVRARVLPGSVCSSSLAFLAIAAAAVERLGAASCIACSSKVHLWRAASVHACN